MHILLKGNPTVSALIASAVALSLLIASFSMFEPAVTFGQETDTFTVTQEIAGEISFLTNPNNVVMSQAISGGITGGSSLGTTTFNITTNDADGYTVTLRFSSTTAMNSTSTPNLHIDNYIPATSGGSDGDYTMSVGAGAHGFAYSVYNVTTPTDVNNSFEHSGANCAGTGSASVQRCWYNQSDASSTKQIIDAAGPTVGTGATTTITFQVILGSNSGVATGWYVATGTLTAAVK